MRAFSNYYINLKIFYDDRNDEYFEVNIKSLEFQSTYWGMEIGLSFYCWDNCSMYIMFYISISFVLFLERV